MTPSNAIASADISSGDGLRARADGEPASALRPIRGVDPPLATTNGAEAPTKTPVRLCWCLVRERRGGDGFRPVATLLFAVGVPVFCRAPECAVFAGLPPVIRVPDRPALAPALETPFAPGPPCDPPPSPLADPPPPPPPPTAPGCVSAAGCLCLWVGLGLGLGFVLRVGPAPGVVCV